MSFGDFFRREVPNPAGRRPQGDPYSEEQSITKRPSDVTPEQLADAIVQTAHAEQLTPEQRLEERINNASFFPGLDYKGYKIIVLYNLDGNDERPVSFAEFIARWRAIPKPLRPDPLQCEHHAYYYDAASGEVKTQETPPEGISNDVIKDHRAEVVEIMTLLTGKKPATTPSGITVEALMALSKKDWRRLFGEMESKNIHLALDAGHDVLNGRREPKPADEGPGEKPTTPKPQQPPQRQKSKPQPTRTSSSRSSYADL